MPERKRIYVGNVRDLPVGEAKKILYPTGDAKGTARPALIVHLDTGFVAYDGLCTHMQAELEWNRYTGRIWCTMHDGMYDPATGKPFLGMPKEPLKKLGLEVEKNGDIYALLT